MILSLFCNTRRKAHLAANRHCRGFTIIELIFTVVILAILMAIGTPYMADMVRDQRVKTATGDLYGSLIFARSEAIKRNLAVAVCTKTDDGSGCQNSNDWSRGWIVFTDADGDGYPAAVADILKRQDKYSDVTMTGTDSRVSYQRDGRIAGGTAPSIILKTPVANVANAARCVNLDLSGRPNIKVDTDKNSSNGCQ